MIRPTVVMSPSSDADFVRKIWMRFECAVRYSVAVKENRRATVGESIVFVFAIDFCSPVKEPVCVCVCVCDEGYSIHQQSDLPISIHFQSDANSFHSISPLEIGVQHAKDISLTAAPYERSGDTKKKCAIEQVFISSNTECFRASRKD